MKADFLSLGSIKDAFNANEPDTSLASQEGRGGSLERGKSRRRRKSKRTELKDCYSGSSQHSSCFEIRGEEER